MAHFQFYYGLYPAIEDGDDRMAMPLLRDVLSAYPTEAAASTIFDLVLVMGHRKRMRINAYVNETLAAMQPASQCVHLEPVVREHARSPVAQPMTIWPGIELRACATSRSIKGIANGVCYEVLSIDTEHRTAMICPTKEFQAEAEAEEVYDDEGEECEEDEDAKEEEENEMACLSDEAFSVSFGVIEKYLRLQHALCLYTIQGRTVSGTVLLMDANHTFFTARHLLVGLSRVTKGCNFAVASSAYE
jgi:hypothetical protein